MQLIILLLPDTKSEEHSKTGHQKTIYYAEELQAELFLDESGEPVVNKHVQMELTKNYFD